MAGNKVDAIFASEAIAQIIKVKQELALADAELINLSQNAAKASASIRGISSPSGLDKTVTDTTQLNAELERQNKIIQGLETQIKKLSQVRAETIKRVDEERLAEIKLQQDREKAFDKFEKQLALEGKAREKAIEMAKKQQLAEEKQAFSRREAFDKNTKKLEAQAVKELSTYNRIQTSVNSLTKTYNDLAIRKELGNTLSKNEEKQLVYLTNRIKTYQDALLKVDSTIGKHQRNVGNYVSGYNALGNSVNQLSREMPAFANSAQTGFMAISNNIPAFQDAIMQLRAGGMSWGGVLKEMGKSVFGLTGMISILTTLLVVLGPKIWDWATGNDGVKASVDRLNSSYERNVELLKQVASNIDHQITLQKELAKQQGKGLKEINDLDEKGARAKLLQSEKIRDALKEQIKQAEIYREDEKKDSRDFEGNLNTRIKGQKAILEARANSSDEALATLKSNLNKAEKEVQSYGKQLSELTARNKTAEIEEAKRAEEKLTEDEKKAREERLRAEYELNKAQLNLQLAKIDSLVNNEDLYYTDRLTALDADLIKRTEIANLDYKEELRLAKDSSEKKKTALINFQIEQLKLIEDYNKKKNNLEKLDLDPITTLNKSKSADGIKDVADSAKTATKELENTAEAVEKTRKQLEDLKKTTEDWLGSFSTEFLQNSGMGSLETFFDGTFDKLLKGAEPTKEKFAVTFNAIAESAQEMFNFISNASQANFDAEYARLESQKENSLKIAGEGTEARKKIEEDYEKKKKEIANRENKAKQKQAIFNIAIDTAQAIIGLWAKPGFPKAIPLAIAVGALGAAQIGMVAAQKIPQYFDGGVHGGGLAMINDAGGSNYVETVVTPDGKVQQFKGRDVVADLPKGTEIFTPEQWQQKELEYMLNSRGVMLNNQASKGFTAEQMDAILAKHFGKIQTNTTVFDKKGIMQFSEMNGNKTIRNANRATGLGFKV